MSNILVVFVVVAQINKAGKGGFADVILFSWEPSSVPAIIIPATEEETVDDASILAAAPIV